MNSFISRRVLLKEMELDFTKMFRETESLYLIVDFKIGASDFKFILSFLLRNEGKYRLQAENHKTRILQCSCHGVRLPTAMQRKENLNGQLGRAKLQLRPTKPESHTQKRCASQKHNCIMYRKSHMLAGQSRARILQASTMTTFTLTEHTMLELPAPGPKNKGFSTSHPVLSSSIHTFLLPHRQRLWH
jgi:hypothetical protein